MSQTHPAGKGGNQQLLQRTLGRTRTKKELKPKQWLEPHEVTGKLSVWELFTLSSELSALQQFMGNLVQRPKTKKEDFENMATERNKTHIPCPNQQQSTEKKSHKNI